MKMSKVLLEILLNKNKLKLMNDNSRNEKILIDNGSNFGFRQTGSIILLYHYKILNSK